MCACQAVFSRVWLLVIPLTIYRSPGFSVHGFSRQEYWSGLPCERLESKFTKMKTIISSVHYNTTWLSDFYTLNFDYKEKSISVKKNKVSFLGELFEIIFPEHLWYVLWFIVSSLIFFKAKKRNKIKNYN